MNKFIIDFYTKEDGEQPAKDFMLELNPKMKAKIIKVLDLLENNGPLTGLPYSEHLENGIFEIRAKQSTNITRVLYFFSIGRKIILTNGFVKKRKKLQNPEVKAEYEALTPEFDIIQALIDARKQQNITQKELSERTGITQADISRIENGTRNPSLAMLKRLAKGIGMQLKVEFIPRVEKR